MCNRFAVKNCKKVKQKRNEGTEGRGDWNVVAEELAQEGACGMQNPPGGSLGGLVGESAVPRQKPSA